MLKSLSVLIVDSKIESRSRLCQALKSIVTSAKIEQARTLVEGTRRIEVLNSIDAIFIESSSDRNKLKEFLSSLKGNEKLKDTILIVVLRSNHQEGGYVADLLREGMHGFICEPFSTEKLLEMLSLARACVNEKPEGRDIIRGSAHFLVGDVITHLNQLSDNLASGSAPGYSKKRLSEAAHSLKEMSALDPEMIAEILTNRFSKVEAPKLKGRKRKQEISIEEALHPGSIIQSMIKKRALTLDKILAMSRIPVEEFELLLQGKRSVDKPTADELARTLGQSSKYWLDLQLAYDKYQDYIAKQSSQFVKSLIL